MKASVIATLAALASVLSIGVAQAGGAEVKTGANYDRPGRAIEDTVRTGADYDKPGRAIEDAVKTGADYDKPGRAIEDTVKTGGEYDRPGRKLDEEAVKAGGTSNKPTRAVEVDPVKYHWVADRSCVYVDEVKAPLAKATVADTMVFKPGRA